MSDGHCGKCRKISISKYGTYYGAGEWMCQDCFNKMKLERGRKW